MGILEKATGWLHRAAGGKTPEPTDDFWYEPAGHGQSQAGIKVTPDIALKSAAVFSCVKLLAETVATMPLHVFTGGREGRIQVDDHPISDVIRFQANNQDTAVEFWGMLLLHAFLRGTGYAEIVPGPRGAVDQLIPLHTDRVIPERLPDRTLRFKVMNEKTGETRVLLEEEILRIPGLSSDGISGLRAVDIAADAIGLGIASETYASRVFSNGVNMGTVLVHPDELSPSAQLNLINRIAERTAGASNAHRPIVLQEDMKVHKVGQTATEAQLIEARKWQVAEIARFWRIPLHLLGQNDERNRATVEEQSINFVRYTIRPITRRIEQAIRRDLIIRKNLFFVSYNLGGLMEGDSKSKAEFYKAALGSGGHSPWMSVNEVRSLENLPTKTGHDDLAEPLNKQVTSEPAAQIEDSSLTARTERLARKEVAAVRKASLRLADDADAMRKWVAGFYGGHVSAVMEALEIPKDAARAYCAYQRDKVLKANDVEGLLQRWEDTLAGEIVSTIESRAAA